MRTGIQGLVGVVLIAGLAAATAQAEDASSAVPLQQERGYFFGYSFGNALKEGGNADVDIEALLEGLKDSLAGVDPRLTSDEQNEVIALVRERQQAVRDEAENRRQSMASNQLAAAARFLAENAQREGVTTTASGLQVLQQVEGTGPAPLADSTVVVHYTGRLLTPDGVLSEAEELIFDSSVRRGEPAEFPLNRVIPGWTEGLQLMRAGGKARLFIPPELGYGDRGTGGIPPNSLLVFDVELIEVK